jgi:hypothetical protein
MTNKASSPLPQLYARWFDDLLGGDIPAETRATCHDCAMCESGGDFQKPNSTFFNPQSKCCTYWPRLPNFLVGMILADEDPAMKRGRESLDVRLQAGLGVTPLGLMVPAKTNFLYNQIEPRAFGRMQDFLCPHYVDEQGGLCGIWKYRNSICSTWFCKYERGAVGHDFWDGVKSLLLVIENDLGRWCAIELELDETALALMLPTPAEAGQRPKLAPEDMDERVDPKAQRRRWGNWFGREQEFYRACADLVAPLSWQNVVAICGPETQLRARLIQQDYRRLTTSEIPERLRLGSFTIADATPEFSRLYHSGLGLDVFQVSSRVMRLLPYFDGRRVSESVEQVVEKEGLRFTDELLRRLVDFKILVAADE